MSKGRLEAFSDGVLAIIITIMVLEMKVPHDVSLASLKPVLPVFLSYVLSFVNIGIYWNNHHHMFQAANQVNGTVLWANIHLLFWLSLFPFTAGWMGENNFATIPVAVYGGISAMAGVAYYILAHSLAGLHGKNSPLAIVLGYDRKGVLSVVMYIIGIGLAFLVSWLGALVYALVAAAWLIPDKRMEKALQQRIPASNH
jgi:uncharacterized membrane protein